MATPASEYAAARKFIVDALQKPALAEEYSDVLDKVHSPEGLEEWLHKHGYETDPEKLAQAMYQYQATNLASWTGIYGKTSLKQSDGKFLPGPPLVVKRDRSVEVAYVALQKFVYKDNTLSWKIADGNPTEGSIKFFLKTGSQIGKIEAPPKGSGVGFTGTLKLSANSPVQAYNGAPGPFTQFPLESWSGNYGKTSVKQPDGKFKKGPALVVVDSTHVTLGETALKNVTYDVIQNQLSWRMPDNSTAGTVKFFKIVKPKKPGEAVGSHFTGTLQESANAKALEFNGQISTPVSLKRWVGFYGVTSLKESNGSFKLGPTLVVQDEKTVILNSSEIKNFTYDGNTNKLSWTTADNSSAASITFRLVTTPEKSGYVGPAFTGTLTQSGGTAEEWNGQIGKQNASINTPSMSGAQIAGIVIPAIISVVMLAATIYKNFDAIKARLQSFTIVFCK